MKKSIIFAGILILVLATILVITTVQANYVKTVPQYTHSLTKAICDEENFCQDVEIHCKNQEIIGMRLTGAAVQFSENWQDPRPPELRNRVC